MIEEKKFLGIMNLDDKEEDILPGQHISALNLRFYGSQNGMTAQNVPGNTLINNTYLPSGDNECIGALFDQLKQRIFWLNWNSNSRHGIYMYDLATQAITPLLVCFTNSQTDILGFDLDYPATDMHIIYTTDADGDILDWNTRNKRPKTLNLLDAINNRYGADWLEKYLDVATEPFTIPIQCAYENDNTVTVNNLRKKLFRFKYRNWYKDNEKSTWSAISEIPVPFQYTDPKIDTDPTKNCKIGCVVQTGDASVTKIEIAAQQSEGVAFGNFFSVVILDKSQLSIPDNDVYLWRFFNNEAYVYVDLDESILQFDRVPDLANCQSLLNGNVRVYGGITDGKDPVDGVAQVSASTERPILIDTASVMSVTQAAESGLQQGQDIRFIIIGNVRWNDTYTAIISVNGTPYTITYTTVFGDTVSSVLSGLSTSATSQGFTQVSISANELVISRTDQVLENNYISGGNKQITGTFTLTAAANTILGTGLASYLNVFNTPNTLFYLSPVGFSANTRIFRTISAQVSGPNLEIVVDNVPVNDTSTTLTLVPNMGESIPVYNPSSKESLGVMYFDEKGKTNGVTTAVTFEAAANYYDILVNLNTVYFNVPYFNLGIYNRPPLWAKYFHIVRTANLTKSKYLYWITDRTYKDDKYAYISLESINAAKVINENSIISYEFTPGDRIKFYLLYNPDATPAAVYRNEHDYEIFSQITNPDINGIVREGVFIKIELPQTSLTFDFSNGLTLFYSYYLIELYTPAKPASENLDVYYEFSERYAIGNPGTNLAFHQGGLQNQSENLVTPATFKLEKGDAWFRNRLISVGNYLLYDFDPGNISGANPINGVTIIPGQTLKKRAYPSNDYNVASHVDQQSYLLTNPPNYNMPGFTINTIVNSYTFRLQGIMNLRINNPTTAFSIIAFTIDSSGYTNYVLDSSTGSTSGVTVTFEFNRAITLLPGAKLYISINSTNANFNADLLSGYISFSEPSKDFTIGAIDENFSDYYDSKVNSNGRSDTVHPDEKTTKFTTQLRWGKAYQQNTNINQVNRFYPLDFDEIDRGKGEIQRLVARDRILRVFQNRAVGQYGVYAKFIQNNSGDDQLVTTNDIITKNNVNYYAGQFGLGDQYASLVSAKTVDYFDDPVRGYEVRVAENGLTPISELYKGQFYIRDLIVPYNQTHLRANGSKAKILGCYNYFDEEKITILQGATDLNPYTFSFNEKRNAYSSFFSFNPEWMISAESTMYSWKDGNLWVHNNTSQYCNFYGSQYDCSIKVVFNINLLEKKSWESIAELASDIWSCPVIYTNTTSYGNQRQETNLLPVDFANLENVFEAAIMRDVNSVGGLLGGDFMKGNYLCVEFLYDNASSLVTLKEVKALFKDSPLTAK